MWSAASVDLLKSLHCSAMVAPDFLLIQMKGQSMTQRSMDSREAVPQPEEWVDLYGNYLYRYALSRISDPDMAQDLVQEALVSAIQSFERFKGKSSVKTWLVAILKRKIVDHFRRSSNRQSTDNIEAVANSIEDMFDDTGHWRVMPSKWRVNPGTAYRQREFMDVLYRCLANMPERLARIFMLREFDEMSTKDICEALSITETNSWVMLYRSRMQLRNCLEHNWLKEDV
jgi:RNA polymerase sigma-70 factor (TIGR02943 family)